MLNEGSVSANIREVNSSCVFDGGVDSGDDEFDTTYVQRYRTKPKKPRGVRGSGGSCDVDMGVMESTDERWV